MRMYGRAYNIIYIYMNVWLEGPQMVVMVAATAASDCACSREMV